MSERISKYPELKKVIKKKQEFEGMLLDHWKEQIVYLEDCIDLLQNGKE